MSTASANIFYRATVQPRTLATSPFLIRVVSKETTYRFSNLTAEELSQLREMLTDHQQRGFIKSFEIVSAPTWDSTEVFKWAKSYAPEQQSGLFEVQQ
jgi:hypothetical protein